MRQARVQVAHHHVLLPPDPVEVLAQAVFERSASMERLDGERYDEQPEYVKAACRTQARVFLAALGLDPVALEKHIQ